MIDTIGQKLKFFTDRSMLSVASMTDSIGIDPSPIRRKQVYSSIKKAAQNTRIKGNVSE